MITEQEKQDKLDEVVREFEKRGYKILSPEEHSFNRIGGRE